MEILGVRVDAINSTQACDEVALAVAEKRQLIIFTPNPEMIVRAQRDAYFRAVINHGDINICDGFGLQLVGGGALQRVSGVDFMEDLCLLAEKERLRVYVLGAGDRAVVDACIQELKKKYPNMTICGGHPGPRLEEKEVRGQLLAVPTDEEVQDTVIHEIIMLEPEILFVGFGHGKQEKWIYEHMPSFLSVRAAVGVGGAIDYIAKKTIRPPKWIRSCGFEWFWRLIRQPSRIKRIWDATVVFMWYNIVHKIKTYVNTKR